MIDNFASFILFLTKAEFVFVLILLGLMYNSYEKFSRLLVIILFSMSYSPLLKSYFSISYSNGNFYCPLAFPSGHMLGSTIFLLCFSYEIKNYFFKLFLFIINISIGVSLIIKGYHDVIDILGGYYFGIIIFLLYKFLVEYLSYNNTTNIKYYYVIISFLTYVMFYFIKNKTSASFVSIGGVTGYSLGYLIEIILLNSKIIFLRKSNKSKLYKEIIVFFIVLTFIALTVFLTKKYILFFYLSKMIENIMISMTLGILLSKSRLIKDWIKAKYF